MPSEKTIAMSSSDQLLAAAWTGAVQGAIACASPCASEPTQAAMDERAPEDERAEPYSEVRELGLRGRACG
jgi:hypothetical protein